VDEEIGTGREDNHEQPPAWRWLVFIIFFVLFPVFFRPWWLAILSMAAFAVIGYFLRPDRNPK
jgi:hypothetical protein